MTPETLGFVETGDDAWTKDVRGRAVVFRLPTDLADLELLEPFQREIMGSSDLDIISGGGLLTVLETGGHVLTATIDGELAGVLYGYGGFVDRTPRIVSDWLGVRSPFRSAGVGAELKRLQIAIALAAGFREIVWTVDPLRAANARLNFERLGAYCDHYEVNRYGTAFAAGLYGGMPSDRLHMTLPITSPEVEARLLGQIAPRSLQDVQELEHYDPAIRAAQALIYLPTDIDAIVATDLNAAMRWRFILREAIQAALDEGFVIRGFVPAIAGGGDLGAYVIERRVGA